MKTVAILCGGRSAEHEISLISAKNIAEAVDKSKFHVEIIGVSREGEWYFCDGYDWLPLSATGNPPKVEEYGTPIAIRPGPQQDKIVFLHPHAQPEGSQQREVTLDIIFPILHGTYGEDGTMQGLLEHLHLPYVGPDTLASAMGMDKDIMKRLLQNAKIPTAKHILLHAQSDPPDLAKIFQELGSPVFVKPANAGSSIGVSKATHDEELHEAIKLAFQFDKKILIEEAIQGREIECAVLGNEKPQASEIGEIVTPDNFYSYRAKYLDKKGAELHAPANLTDEQKHQAQQVALDTYKTLLCEGLTRVDMFLTNNNKIFVNEINTLPGFTKISMYPTLWQKNGVTYTELITKLIELATERYNRKNALRTNMPDEV